MKSSEEHIHKMAYLNTRLRSRKNTFLKREILEEFLDQFEVSYCIDYLLQSHYAQELTQSLNEFQGIEAIENALLTNFSNNLRQILQMVDGEIQEKIKLFLFHWDNLSIKNILRFFYPQRQSLQKFPMLNVITLTPNFVSELIKAQDLYEVIVSLAKWNPKQWGTLPIIYQVHQKNLTLNMLEESLDYEYYVVHALRLKKSQDLDDNILGTTLARHIDLINLRNIFYVKYQSSKNIPHKKINAEDFVGSEKLLHGGTLDKKFLNKLMNLSNVESVVENLKGTPYEVFVHRLYQFIQSGRFSPLERLFHEIMMRWYSRMAQLHPLSIAVTMEYVWKKFNEVVNIRVITHGIASKLTRGRILEELIHV